MSNPASSSLLRRVLLMDGAISGATGVLLAVAAGPLAALLAVPAPLLRYAGLMLVPFGLALVYLSRRDAIPPAAVAVVIGLNAAWVAASVAVLVLEAIEPNTLGIAFVLGQAVAVAGLGEGEYVGLRRHSMN